MRKTEPLITDHSLARNPITIAVIGGTGREGTGLGLRWAAAGYRIVIGSRDVEKARLAAEAINTRLGINTTVGLTNPEAVRLAELCVLTVVHTAHQQALESLKDVLQGKILVDATSRVDYRDPRPPEPPSAGQIAQELLGAGTKVVAAFQNVPAQSLSREIGKPIDAEVFVCSDDLQAAERVIKLAEDAGMRGYYSGKLANAIVVEGLTSMMISMNKYYKVKDASVRVTGIPEV